MTVMAGAVGTAGTVGTAWPLDGKAGVVVQRMKRKTLLPQLTLGMELPGFWISTPMVCVIHHPIACGWAHRPCGGIELQPLNSGLSGLPLWK